MQTSDTIENRDTFLRDLGLLVEKGLYTVEDVAIHLRRGIITAAKEAKKKNVGNGASQVSIVSKKDSRRRIIVIGSGWASHAFLKVSDIDDNTDIVCISPTPYFVFTPMLSAAAVGSVEYRSIVEPIRGANPIADYIEGNPTSDK
jgi:NADH:ubiquinone reductase (non-electrogenic)